MPLCPPFVSRVARSSGLLFRMASQPLFCSFCAPKAADFVGDREHGEQRMLPPQHAALAAARGGGARSMCRKLGIGAQRSDFLCVVLTGKTRSLRSLLIMVPVW